MTGPPPGEAEHPLHEAKPPLPRTERLLAGAGGQFRGRATARPSANSRNPPTSSPPAATSKAPWTSRDAPRRGVQTYIAQQATSSSGPWTQCYVGKASSCTVTGLTSGTQYWFQVSAIGAAGSSAWSDPATKRAT